MDRLDLDLNKVASNGIADQLIPYSRTSVKMWHRNDIGPCVRCQNAGVRGDRSESELGFQ